MTTKNKPSARGRTPSFDWLKVLPGGKYDLSDLVTLTGKTRPTILRHMKLHNAKIVTTKNSTNRPKIEVYWRCDNKIKESKFRALYNIPKKPTASKTIVHPAKAAPKTAKKLAAKV